MKEILEKYLYNDVVRRFVRNVQRCNTDNLWYVIFSLIPNFPVGNAMISEVSTSQRYYTLNTSFRVSRRSCKLLPYELESS